MRKFLKSFLFEFQFLFIIIEEEQVVRIIDKHTLIEHIEYTAVNPLVIKSSRISSTNSNNKREKGVRQLMKEARKRECE
jgi:hypothetical protein